MTNLPNAPQLLKLTPQFKWTCLTPQWMHTVIMHGLPAPYLSNCFTKDGEAGSDGKFHPLIQSGSSNRSRYMIFSKHWHKQKFENLMWLLWAIKRLYSVGMPFTFTIHHQRLSDTLKVTIENTVILRDGIVLKRHSRTIAEWFQLRSIFRDEFFFQLKWRRFVGWGVSRRWGDKRGDTHFYLSLAHLLIVAYFPCVWQILVPSCGLPSPFH